MEIEEVVVEIVMGLFLLFLSYQVGIKENITSVSYTHLRISYKFFVARDISVRFGLYYKLYMSF